MSKKPWFTKFRHTKFTASGSIEYGPWAIDQRAPVRLLIKRTNSSYSFELVLSHWLLFQHKPRMATYRRRFYRWRLLSHNRLVWLCPIIYCWGMVAPWWSPNQKRTPLRSMLACKLKKFNKIPALVEGKDKPNVLQMANVDLFILIVAVFTSVEDTKSMAHLDSLWGL